MDPLYIYIVTLFEISYGIFDKGVFIRKSLCHDINDTISIIIEEFVFTAYVFTP